jgi:hypothetical protein
MSTLPIGGNSISFWDRLPYHEHKKPLHYSYLYSSSERQNYCFQDPEMEQVSFLPPFEINGKKVIFTINRQLALYYDQSFIYTISILLKKIKLPQSLDPDLLDKIATAVNYLSKGIEYEYLPGTAKQAGMGMIFLVKKGEIYCQATLSCLQGENSEICYQEVT